MALIWDEFGPEGKKPFSELVGLLTTGLSAGISGLAGAPGQRLPGWGPSIMRLIVQPS